VLPFLWSFMLAARSRGLVSAWTQLHLMYEEEAAEILGIPFADVAQAALIPVAYPIGGGFKSVYREPLEQYLHFRHLVARSDMTGSTNRVRSTRLPPARAPSTGWRVRRSASPLLVSTAR